MTKYIFDTDEIECSFSSGQIKHYMKENKFIKLLGTDSGILTI